MRLICLIVVYVLVSCNITLWAQFSGGSGTPSDPYRIATLDDLKTLSESAAYWDKFFIQTADIDASSTNGWNDGMGTIPIGNDAVKFTGIYDGGNHIISNLYINRDTTDYVGLFGYTSSPGIIKNTRLVNGSVTGKSYVGMLVGRNLFAKIEYCLSDGVVYGKDPLYSRCGGLIGSNAGQISFCYSEADVIAEGAIAGGLAGMHTNVMEKCYATGNVSGTGTVGGLVGTATGTIKECYSVGQVTGTGRTGGLAGEIGLNSDLSDCYSRSNLVNQSYAGGFAGYISDSNAKVDKCYATGTFSNKTGYANIGGFAGAINTGASVTNSYWDTEVSGIMSSAAGEGRTTAELKNESTYLMAGWDFVCESENGTVDIWAITENGNNGYPFLVWQGLSYDTEAPVILNSPENKTEYIQTDCHVLLGDFRTSVTATDNCTPDAKLVILQNPEPGTLLSLGETQVTLSVKDGSGNESITNFTITVADTVKPMPVCPENQQRILSDGVNVYTVSGEEFNPIAITENCTLESVVNNVNGNSTLEGTNLNAGTSRITWTATDGSGNQATCSFDITVSHAAEIETDNEPAIRVYPNPVTSFIEIEVTHSDERYIAMLIDANGRMVSNSDFRKKIHIPMQELKEGMYILKVGKNNQYYLWNILKIR